MQCGTSEIAAAIGQGIVDQANYLGALATAIFGGMVAVRLQFKLSDVASLQTHWSCLFWIATVFLAITIGLVFVISGAMIELAPVFYSFPFEAKLQFSEHDFEGTGIGRLKAYSRIQVLVFILSSVFSGLFILRNIVGSTKQTNGNLITTQAKRNLSSRSGIGGVLSAT